MLAYPYRAQQLPTPAVTFDLSDRLSCDGLDGLADAFVRKMLEFPAANGLVIIAADPMNPSLAIRFQGELHKAIVFNRFGQHRPLVKFAPPSPDKATVNLYLSPGEFPPKNAELTDQPRFAKLSTPFFYNSDFSEACETIQLDQFVAFLMENPELKAKIIVYANQKSTRLKVARKWARMLIEQFGLERARFRILLQRKDPQLNFLRSYTGFYITP